MFGIVDHISCPDKSPGRYYAVHQLKLILAFMLLKYDIKTQNGVRPSNWEFGPRTVPNMTAKILFRRRRSDTF